MSVVVFSKIILKISYWSSRVCGENTEGLLATPQLFARVPEAKYVTQVRWHQEQMERGVKVEINSTI